MKLIWSIIMLIALLFVVVTGSIAPVQGQAACMFTPSVEGARLYHAPLTDPMQERAVLQVGIGYLIERSHGEHFFITLDGINGGWVDRRSGGVSGDCTALPVDATPLADFPTICTLTLTQPSPIFGDIARTQSRGTLPAGQYVIVKQGSPNGQVLNYYVVLDHAMGAWIAADPAQLSGNCGVLPNANNANAYALANARAWSAPNVKTGDALFTLTEGIPVLIVQGPVSGPIRFDTDDTGNWYQVVVGDQRPVWIWEARLDFAPPPNPVPVPSPAPVTHYTLENARLWTVPDVKTGSITAYLPSSVGLTLIAGPVNGPIRFDTDDQGQWYYVQPTGDYLPGWIWVARFTQ